MVSDIHEDLDIVQNLGEKLDNENINAVVIAGGIGCYHKQRQDEYLQNVSKIFDMLGRISKKILYIPGGTDYEELNIHDNNTINIHKDVYVIQHDGMKIGFFGLGGVPSHSFRYNHEFPYRWTEKILYESYIKKLKIDYEKLKTEKPDYIILVSHSPPYNIADYAKKATLNVFELTEEMGEEDIEKKEKISFNPVHLGSRILKDFLNKYQVDIHLFGHVHKKGGSKVHMGETVFFNVSHLSVDPYKLTGRKYLVLKLDRNNINYNFDSIVNKDLTFEQFIGSYL